MINKLTAGEMLVRCLYYGHTNNDAVFDSVISLDLQNAAGEYLLIHPITTSRIMKADEKWRLTPPLTRVLYSSEYTLTMNE